MSKSRWRRVGSGSGPANLYDDRYLVERVGSRWRIFDQQRNIEATTRRFQSMKDARDFTEARFG